MKKIFLYSLAVLASVILASCNGDYDDWAQPQHNPQEEAITIPGFTATPVVQSIDCSNVTTDSVSIFTLSEAALPEGFTLDNARLEIIPQGEDNAIKKTVNASIEGKAAVADLSEVIVSFYGKRPIAHSFVAHVYLNAMKNGDAVLIDAGKFNLEMTPKAPFIDSGYYLVGDMFNTEDVNGWNTISDKQAFMHSDKDVYDDPNFTITFETTKANQYWKIIPKANVDAGNTDASAAGVVGPKENGSFSMEGSLTNVGPGAGMIKEPGKYKLTLNMMDYTYTIKQIASEYYLVGDLQSWSDKTMSCLMTAESAMVQNFTTKWTGAANLKIWLGSDFGNWDNAFGSAEGDGLSVAEGKLKVNGGAIVCPEKNAYYTFTADFSTMTYKWTKLANQNPTEFEYVALIGVGGKWNDGDDIDLTLVAPHNWYKANVKIPEGGFKIRADHKWSDDGSGNWGFGEGQKYESKGTLITSGTSGNIPVPAGTYNIYFNDITGAYAFVEVK